MQKMFLLHLFMFGSIENIDNFVTNTIFSTLNNMLCISIICFFYIFPDSIGER